MRLERPTLAAGAAAFLLAIGGTAIAHHGWSWTAEEESELSGTIETLSLGNPHAHLDLRNADGLWDVDLAPPSATARSGFVAGIAKVGDAVVLTGHKSKDPKELRFKAETVEVNGKLYDVYPNREKTLNPS